jgi:hypothetical protein
MRFRAGGAAVAAGRRLRLAWTAVMILSMALIMAGGAGCTDSVETKVVFQRDWEAAKDQAASENKPIMVNFYTDT